MNLKSEEGEMIELHNINPCICSSYVNFDLEQCNLSLHGMSFIDCSVGWPSSATCSRRRKFLHLGKF